MINGISSQYKRFNSSRYLKLGVDMYSRKEFLVMAVKQCSDFVKKVNSELSHAEEETINGSEGTDPDSMFLEAMRLGIDPGTMDMNQLSRTLSLAKEQLAEKGGGDQSENG